jgi:hypothetical protein
VRVTESDAILFNALQAKLAAHDDREFFRAALSVLADEFA